MSNAVDRNELSGEMTTLQPSARLSFCCTPLHPPLPSARVKMRMERGVQQNARTLADGSDNRGQGGVVDQYNLQQGGETTRKGGTEHKDKENDGDRW